MFKKLTITCVALSALTFVGCASLDKVTMGVVDKDLQLILPEYKNYVQNDPVLEDSEKEDRLRLADELDKLVKESLK